VRRAAKAATLLLATLGPAGAAGEVRGAAPGDFDLYVLSLTWSPGFCASGGERRDPEQCASGAGFLVHGLWPQYQGDGYPTECGPSRSPLSSDFDAIDGVMPSRRLARYEWRKHGTCSGLPPSRYFQAVAAARQAVTVPERLGDGGEVAPLDIERAFATANPGLRPDMTAIACGRSDDGDTVLREVRICFTKDLRRFQSCPPAVERGACHARAITVPAREAAQ
jgi:ribonuclease T2